MEIALHQALGPVKTALMDAADRSEKRRLRVYGAAVPCKPGCASCCSRYVVVTVAEAMVVYVHLKENGTWEDVRRAAKEQLPALRSASPVSWLLMNNPCPVLDPSSSTCRAWPVRPGPCSTHFVTSDPALCDPWASGGGPFSPLDFDDLFGRLQEAVHSSLEGGGILSLRLPLPAALLMAESASVRSGLDVAKAVELVFNEL